MDNFNEESLIKSILLAPDITDRVNKMDLYDLNQLLNKVTGQNIPDYIVTNAINQGITNMEYLVGSYLTNRRYYNLLCKNKVK